MTLRTYGDDRSFASAPRAQAKPASRVPESVEIMGWVVGLVTGIFLLFLLTLYTRSTLDLQAHLTAESNSSSSMVCKDGSMTYGDGSIPDRVFEDGRFVCTGWRTAQGLELEAAERVYRKRY